MIIQIGCTGHSARKHQDICIGKVASLFKCRVGFHGNAMRTLNKLCSCDTDGYNIYASSAEYIQRSQGFNVLKSIGHEYIYFSHNSIIL